MYEAKVFICLVNWLNLEVYSSSFTPRVVLDFSEFLTVSGYPMLIPMILIEKG